jgi:arginine decarboxylase
VARCQRRRTAVFGGCRLTRERSTALLIASIDAARRQFVEDGERLIEAALELVAELRDAIAAIPGLSLMSDDVLRRPGASGFNPLHVSFDVTGLGITGYHASDWLRGHHSLAIELADHRRLMALVSFADDHRAIQRLCDALRTSPTTTTAIPPRSRSCRPRRAAHRDGPDASRRLLRADAHGRDR